MTGSIFRVRGQEGVATLYQGPEDLALEADPRSDLARVAYSSRLAVIPRKKVTVQYTVPELLQNSRRSQRIAIEPHGYDFTPAMFAILKGWPNGDGTPVDIPINGSLLLDFYGQRPGDNGVFEYDTPGGLDRWSDTWRRTTGFNNAWHQKAWTLGVAADGSDLILWFEQTVWDDAGASYPETTITIDYYVGDLSVDGMTSATPLTLYGHNGSETILTGSNVAAPGAVALSSNRYYPRRSVGNGEFAVATRPSTVYRYVASGNQSQQFGLAQAPNWRWNIQLWQFGSAPFLPLPDPGFVEMDVANRAI